MATPVRDGFVWFRRPAAAGAVVMAGPAILAGGRAPAIPARRAGECGAPSSSLRASHGPARWRDGAAGDRERPSESAFIPFPPAPAVDRIGRAAPAYCLPPAAAQQRVVRAFILILRICQPAAACLQRTHPAARPVSAAGQCTVLLPGQAGSEKRSGLAVHGAIAWTRASATCTN